jgi:hypothetical protein
MALLDNLLGGGDQSSTKSLAVGGEVATNPSVDLHAADVLHVLNAVDTGLGSVATELTGIGNLDAGVQAPLAASVGATYDSEGHGGLLGGLL